MHHGKSRGKRKTHKVCKKHVNSTYSEGKFGKVGGKEKFPEIGGKCIETAKIGANSKIGKLEKVKFGKFSMESENVVGNMGEKGKSETEGNASLPQGGWTPLPFKVSLH